MNLTDSIVFIFYGYSENIVIINFFGHNNKAKKI